MWPLFYLEGFVILLKSSNLEYFHVQHHQSDLCHEPSPISAVEGATTHTAPAHTIASSLSLLHSFPSVTYPTRAQFHRGLQQAESIICFSSPADMETVQAFMHARYGEKVEYRDLPSPDASTLDAEAAPGVLAVTVNRAIDPDLKDKFFSTPSVARFVDHEYWDPLASGKPELLTVGASESCLQTILSEGLAHDDGVVTDTMPALLRSALQSSTVHTVLLHALGPEGTNIAQASRLYLERLGLTDKAQLIVHDGVEPREYAGIAARLKREGVISLHMECAVYYEMGRLYRERSEFGEVVFADHQYMPLDEMQLVMHGETPQTQRSLSSETPLTIASHPSPKALLNPLLDRGLAVWKKATSNAAAAQMLARGEVDAAITTEQARSSSGLTQVHSFGSPIMLFTIGTPLSHQELIARGGQ